MPNNRLKHFWWNIGLVSLLGVEAALHGVGFGLDSLWRQADFLSKLPVSELRITPTAMNVGIGAEQLEGAFAFDFVKMVNGWKGAGSFELGKTNLNFRSAYAGSADGYIDVYLRLMADGSLGQLMEPFLPASSKDVLAGIDWSTVDIEVYAEGNSPEHLSATAVIGGSEVRYVDQKGTELYLPFIAGGLVWTGQVVQRAHLTGRLGFGKLAALSWDPLDFDIRWCDPLLTVELGEWVLTTGGHVINGILNRFEVVREETLASVEAQGSLTLSGNFRDSGHYHVSGSISGLERFEAILFRQFQFTFKGAGGEWQLGPFDWDPESAVNLPLTVRGLNTAYWMQQLPPQKYRIEGLFDGTIGMIANPESKSVVLQSGQLKLKQGTSGRFVMLDEEMLRGYIDKMGGSAELRKQLMEALRGGIVLQDCEIVLQRHANGGMRVRLELSGEARSEQLVVPIGRQVITNNFEGTSFAQLMRLWGFEWIQ